MYFISFGKRLRNAGGETHIFYSDRSNEVQPKALSVNVRKLRERRERRERERKRENEREREIERKRERKRERESYKKLFFNLINHCQTDY